MIDTDYEVPLGLSNGMNAGKTPLATRSDVRSPTSSRTEVRSPTSTRTEVRSPTSTRTEVRSPTRTSTEVRSPTRTATEAYTQGNFTSTVTGGAGAGATHVTINIPAQNWRKVHAGGGPRRGALTEQEPFGFDINKNNIESREPAFGFDITKDAIDPSSGSLYSGGSSYSPELQGFSSAMGMSSLQLPLCQRDIAGSLGNFKRGLAGLDDIMDQDVKTDSFAAVANAAAAGSSYAAPFAKRLAEAAGKWSSIAKERYRITDTASAAYNRLYSQVVDLDRKVVELTTARKSAEASKVKKEAVNKAKVAVQYQKVNALSTTLADNASSQASLLREIANSAVTGQADKVNTLAKLYYQLAAVSKKAVDLRKKQLAGIKGGLQGVRRPFIDYFEEELNGLTRKSVAPRAAIVNGYTVEQMGNKTSPKLTFVSNVLKKTAARVKQAKNRMFPMVRVRLSTQNKPAPRFYQGKNTDFGAIPDFGALPVPKINFTQIARQGTGAATATLMNSNIRGITPEQLTSMARQAQVLFNGSTGSAASIVAQARRL